jgi:hypothetical protein
VKTVIFLGAGASKPLGLPLTNDILPEVVDRLINKSLFGADESDQRRILNRCLTAILPGFEKLAAAQDPRHTWREALPSITDLLSALDYLAMSGNAPARDFSFSDLIRSRLLLERAVFELLARTASANVLGMADIPKSIEREWHHTAELKVFPRSPSSDELENLKKTVDWIMELGASSRDPVIIISTNYDIEVEQELYVRLGYKAVFNDIDFGVSVRDPDPDSNSATVHRRPNHPRFGVYKLHGSLNWLRCDVCDNIYVNPVGAIAYLSFLPEDGVDRRTKTEFFESLKEAGANECHCGYRPLRHVIVAPSYVREVRDPILLEIWRNALEALRSADEWIIVGYSLPPEDVAIRSMFLRAYQGRDTDAPPRISVVQKEGKGPEVSRYRLLFPDHSYFPGGLSGYLSRAQQQ